MDHYTRAVGIDPRVDGIPAIGPTVALGIGRLGYQMWNLPLTWTMPSI
jgi:hypothetical protein